jgi:hypothetical protein
MNNLSKTNTFIPSSKIKLVPACKFNPLRTLFYAIEPDFMFTLTLWSVTIFCRQKNVKESLMLYIFSILLGLISARESIEQYTNKKLQKFRSFGEMAIITKKKGYFCNSSIIYFANKIFKDTLIIYKEQTIESIISDVDNSNKIALQIYSFITGYHLMIALYDKNLNELYFYDSNGKPPDIMIVTYLCKIFRVHKIKYNNIQHQGNNDWCTIYALTAAKKFIEENSSFEQVCKEIPSIKYLKRIYDDHNKLIRNNHLICDYNSCTKVINMLEHNDKIVLIGMVLGAYDPT